MLEPPAGRCLSQGGCHGTSPRQHMDRDRGIDSPFGKFNTSSLSVYETLSPCIFHSATFHFKFVTSAKGI